jgi:hypothetical protein
MERPMLKLLENHQEQHDPEAACNLRNECPVCGTWPCKIANPDRAQEARIGDLAIGRYRIDLPLSRLKCVQTPKILP